MAEIKPIEELTEDADKGDIVRLLFGHGEFIGYYEGVGLGWGDSPIAHRFSNAVGKSGVCGNSVRLEEGVLYLDGGRFPKNWFSVDKYEILGKQNIYPER